MKNYLCSSILLLAVISCKQHEEVKPKPADKAIAAAEANACNHNTIVVIDKGKLGSGIKYEKWYQANQEYLCDKKISSEPKSCTNYLVIDLTKIPEENEDEEEAIAGWLKRNTDYICFEKSYAFIHANHVITDKDMIAKIETAIRTGNPPSPTLESFVGSIPYFDIFNYEMYISFSKNASNVIEWKAVSSLEHSLKCYSIPLFKSIMKEYSITPGQLKDFHIEFVEIKDDDQHDLIAFKISKGTLQAYYDYSTNPDLVNTGSVQFENYMFQ